MNSLKTKRVRMIVGIIVGIVAVAVAVGFVLSISRVSGGLLKENGWRGLKSPHYKDGRIPGICTVR